jgi:hypothetical protein
MTAREKDREQLKFVLNKLCNWNAEFDKSKAPIGKAGPVLDIDGNEQMSAALLQDVYMSKIKLEEIIRHGKDRR